MTTTLSQSHTADTALASAHYEHLISEGFNPEMIWSMEQKGICSYSKNKALSKGFKIWSTDHWESSSGLYFPFTQTFGQIRCDQKISRPGKSKLVKYLTPVGANTQAFIPKNCKVITEGAKDAWAGCLHGQMPTGAVAGVSHIRKALKPGCGITILFDSDGWQNPQVASNLLLAAIHCNGKIQLVPELEGDPKGGLCEYFKSGKSAESYQKLIDEAMHPDQFLWEWLKRWSDYPPSLKARCAKVASVYAMMIGALAS